jgi:hypothetical protein
MTPKPCFTGAKASAITTQAVAVEEKLISLALLVFDKLWPVRDA